MYDAHSIREIMMLINSKSIWRNSTIRVRAGRVMLSCLSEAHERFAVLPFCDAQISDASSFLNCTCPFKARYGPRFECKPCSFAGDGDEQLFLCQNVIVGFWDATTASVCARRIMKLCPLPVHHGMPRHNGLRRLSRE